MGQSAEFGKFLKAMRSRLTPEKTGIASISVDAVGKVPALVLGRRTDVLAGNRLAFLLTADFPAMPAAERNLTRWIILDPLARELFRDWNTVAAAQTA